jgi:hypothetical protein
MRLMPIFDSGLSSYVRPVLKEEAGVPTIDEIKRAQYVVTAAYSLVLAPFLASCAMNVNTGRHQSSLGSL